MDAGKLLEQAWTQLEALAFNAQYCAGKNISGAFCDNFRHGVMGIAALVLAFVAWRLIRKLMRFYAGWRYRRASAVVADTSVMDRHRWTGDARAGVKATQEELAAQIRKSLPPGGGAPDRKN
jgi:hypothetical protein